jgi:hypothetical protein
MAGSLPGVLVETLPKKLPNRGYARCDVNILGIGAKDCGGGIPTKQPDYAKLEPRSNNQDERRKVENPHGVAPITVAIMAAPLREYQSDAGRAVRTRTDPALLDIGHFPPNTTPDD